MAVLPPVVTGAVVMLIGFNLASVATITYFPTEQWIGLLTTLLRDLETAAAQLAKEMHDLRAGLKNQAAQIEKISAQLETSRPIPQVVVNK